MVGPSLCSVVYLLARVPLLYHSLSLVSLFIEPPFCSHLFIYFFLTFGFLTSTCKLVDKTKGFLSQALLLSVMEFLTLSGH